MVSKEDFLAYENVRVRGVTNMFAINVVQELSGLERETILNIMDNYSEYRKKYLDKLNED
ncbi:hypothetical protein FACS189431_2040 [Alphaproteobacteria bacterium]|nr:hypothetical protein FACS189431_2040 [Alphaproteobacteria bacterium]